MHPASCTQSSPGLRLAKPVPSTLLSTHSCPLPRGDLSVSAPSTFQNFTTSTILPTFAILFYLCQMRIVDTKGQLCPAPLISTKRALKETPVGESFLLLTDNKTSFNNVSRFLKDNNTSFQVRESEGMWTLTITRGEGDVFHSKTEDYGNNTITHFQKGDFIIVISSDKMGDGDNDLGLLLMSNFIKAIKDLDKLPKKIVFYNKGVTLVTKKSPLIDHLTDLEKMGVELLLCATCVNHYSISDVISAGTLSNMYAIAEVMSSAGNIVRP
jgi:selenium metabolism protein YedF